MEFRVRNLETEILADNWVVKLESRRFILINICIYSLNLCTMILVLRTTEEVDDVQYKN